MSTNLTPVSVTPATPPIMAVEHEGKPWVSVKHVCEALGIDTESQRKKLKSKPWTCSVMITAQVSGQGRETYMIDRRTLTMWLATIDTNRVSEAARPTLEAYQLEAADALDRYFHEGGAINPNATTDQLDRLDREVQRRRESAELLTLLQDVLPKAYAETVGKELIAESRGHTPTVPEHERTLEVMAYLNSKGVPKNTATKYASSFGRKVKEHYIATTGELPKSAPKMVNGATREVTYYTQTDRHIFDTVWNGYADNHTLKLEATN